MESEQLVPTIGQFLEFCKTYRMVESDLYPVEMFNVVGNPKRACLQVDWDLKGGAVRLERFIGILEESIGNGLGFTEDTPLHLEEWAGEVTQQTGKDSLWMKFLEGCSHNFVTIAIYWCHRLEEGREPFFQDIPYPIAKWYYDNDPKMLRFDSYSGLVALLNSKNLVMGFCYDAMALNEFSSLGELDD